MYVYCVYICDRRMWLRKFSQIKMTVICMVYLNTICCVRYLCNGFMAIDALGQSHVRLSVAVRPL